MALFHIDGIENAILSFERIETQLYGPQILQIFQVAGDAVAALAASKARVRTGFLAGGVFAKAYARDTVPNVILGVETGAPSYGHRIVPYAGYQNFGTKNMEGNYFLSNAAAEMEPQLLDLVGTAIAKLLDL